jgi:hypothetical protein
VATHPDNPPTRNGFIVNQIEVFGAVGIIFGFLTPSSVTGVGFAYEDISFLIILRYLLLLF